MDNKSYYLPEEYVSRIIETTKGKSFAEAYISLKSLFRESFAKESVQEPFSLDEQSGKWLVIVNDSIREYYDGRLWDDERISYIGLMDFLYTVPLWDWWISPLLSRKKHRKNKESLIFTELIARNDLEDICRRVEYEGYKIVSTENLDHPKHYAKKEVEAFLKMIFEILPGKIAHETVRLSSIIENGGFDQCSFVLRSGFLLEELLKSLNPNIRSDLLYIGEKTKGGVFEQSGITSNSLVIDDAIGTAKTIQEILRRYNLGIMNYATMDSTLPKEFYSTAFPNINFFLPQNSLNIYGCRLFENMPNLIGLDIEENSDGFNILQKSNKVRDKFIGRLRAKIYEQEEKHTFDTIHDLLQSIKTW